VCTHVAIYGDHRAGRRIGVCLQCDEPNGLFRKRGILVLARHAVQSAIPCEVQPGQEHIPDVFDQVGAPYTLLTPASEMMAYPQVRIRTNAWIPFVISERFDAAADAIKRVSFTAHYLAIFGIPLSMGDSFDIPTSLP
jgi:hypothetical protein